jgi:hypothetical protein
MRAIVSIIIMNQWSGYMTTMPKPSLRYNEMRNYLEYVMATWFPTTSSNEQTMSKYGYSLLMLAETGHLKLFQEIK